MCKTLIIDNYDSFTYNLVHLVAEINGELPLVIKNNTHTLTEIQKLQFDNIIISPGPGNPGCINDFGVCAEVLQKIDVPILGVCLGHQGMCTVLGGQVVAAPLPMHGRISTIVHYGDPLFKNIPFFFQEVRYHSLIIKSPVPDELIVIARTEDGLIMGVRHRDRPWWGVQYHPESICSTYGRQLLVNFKDLSVAFSQLRHNNINCPPSGRKTTSLHTAKLDASKKTYTVNVKKFTHQCSPEVLFKNYFVNEPHAVWLDSSQNNDDAGRFSYMGDLNGPYAYRLSYDVSTNITSVIKKDQVTTYALNIFDFLQQELSKENLHSEEDFPFVGGFVGYLGYELNALTLDLPIVNHEQPTAQFLFLDRVVIYDHHANCAYGVALSRECPLEANSWLATIETTMNSLQAKPLLLKNNYKSKPVTYHLSADREAYLAQIQKCFQALRDGDSYELCLTNCLTFMASVDPFKYYCTLREMNAAPYAAFLKLDKLAIASSSIEKFLSVTSEGYVETKPIKGTLPRGNTPQTDAELRSKLANDEHFQAEHLMIVDLLRNDLSRVCKICSVQVPEFMKVESYPTLHQLVSTISGQLKDNKTALDALKAVFPGGSMTGAPKRRSVLLLQSIEKKPRGIYSGAIGYLSLNGAAKFNIVIRTAVFTDSKIEIGVGGAIIASSSPEVEFSEILLKSKALHRALESMSD